MSKQVMTAIHTMTLRDLIQKVNDLEIQKEDIVMITKEEDVFFLLYYKSIKSTEQ